jgi:hypothetical protein
MTDIQWHAKVIALLAYLALRALWFFPWMMLRQMQGERRER